MTQQQLEQAAQIDITYFMVAYKACPTCGRKFDEMHPAENLYPHWTRACAALAKDRQSNHDSVQRAVAEE